MADAPWMGRFGLASVIDAAGAIYVIGGRTTWGDFNDVWKSTDGGADRTRAGYSGVLSLTMCQGVPRGHSGYSRGTHGGLQRP